MRKLTLIWLIASLSLLTACPYVGEESDGDTCVDFVTPIGVMTSVVERPKCDPHRLHNLADPATVRIKYTEQERRAMADEAAFLLYPWSAAAKASHATGAAESIVNAYIPNAYRDACAMLVALNLAPQLENKLPAPEVYYKAAANVLLSRYGDDQLELILKKAKRFGSNTELRNELFPQLPLSGGLTGYLGGAASVTFVNQNKKNYQAYVLRNYAKLTAEHGSKDKKTCYREKQ